MSSPPPSHPPSLRSLAGLLLAAGLSCWLVACSTPGSAPRGAPAPHGRPAPPPLPRGADGPPEGPAPDVSAVPDAEPRVEPIRSGGPNKPYEVLGQSYTPVAKDEPVVERGLASWYGRKFHGRRTASGEVYNMMAMTAAHKTMPIPSYARVRNPANGREVIVRVNDRGPFSAKRIIDLSYTAAVKLGVHHGVAPVEVERITHDEIRAGLGSRTAEQGVSVALNTAAGNLPARAGTLPRAAARGAAAPPAAGPTLIALAPTEAGPDAAATPPAPLPNMPAALLVAASPSAAATSAGAEAPPPVAAQAIADAAAAAAAQLPGPTPDRARAFTAAAAGFWLQLGAFGRGEGAYSFQQRVAQELDWLSPLLTVFADGGLHRLQAGPYRSRGEAREVAERVRTALQLVPVVVERR